MPTATATATLERADRADRADRAGRREHAGAVVVPICPDVVVGPPVARPAARPAVGPRRRGVPDPSTASRMLAGATLALVAAVAIAVLPGGTEVGPNRVEVPAGPVAAGAVVVVAGSCGHQTSGTASSLAFAGAPGSSSDPTGPGVAAFATDADGGFTARAVVARQAAPGTYLVSVRCAGAPSAATADLEVVAPAAS